MEVEVLSGVPLKVDGGEFVALCDPSRSGKTTLVNVKSAIDKPANGKVLTWSRTWLFACFF